MYEDQLQNVSFRKQILWDIRRFIMHGHKGIVEPDTSLRFYS